MTRPGRLPNMPSAITMARHLREGVTLEAICTQYQRQPKTIVQRLNHAGYGSDGVELRRRAPVVIVLQPWHEVPRFMDQAACADVDPALFYANWGIDHGFTKQAKVVCAACPVKTECLTYALENHERYGIWGGLTVGERRRLLRKTA